MKILLSLVAVAAMVLVSCSKDESPTNPQPATTNNRMSATINGTAWTSTNAIAMRTSGIMQITGTADNTTSGYQLVVQMIDSKVGTYDIGSGMNQVIVNKYNNGSASVEPATAGTITVTKSDASSIEGTFEFTASGFTVTNGKWTANF